MKNYYDFLSQKKLDISYVNSFEEKSDIRKFIDGLDPNEINKINRYLLESPHCIVAGIVNKIILISNKIVQFWI